ncbi:hypothetical protein [Nitrobacter hamburgensis]|uniref:hypothetical protein n=1 Tax=Nitrobacter hamburgensis TaxID=912 RepID=UPI00031078D6|nr:hypothetical protein [Nitrobacter hamburgensis]
MLTLDGSRHDLVEGGLHAVSAVAQSFLAFLTQQARPLASPKHPQPAPLTP